MTNWTIDPKYLFEYLELDEQPFGVKFYLGDPLYYFMYRPDKNNGLLKIAELFNVENKIISILRVSEERGFAKKSHHQVIDFFEVAAMRL